MTYPTKYSRQYDFQSYQVSNPTRPLPGDKVNVDLNAVVTSVDEIVEFLKTSIRSDGRLANGSVGVNQLDATFDLGFSLPTTWEAGVAYTTDSTVLHNNKFYIANVAHTSTDGFDESKWDEIVDFGAQATAAAASATAAAASETAAAASATAAAASAVVQSSLITPESFGADGTATKDTDGIQACIDSGAAEFQLQPRVYLLDQRGLVGASNQTWRGCNGQTIIRQSVAPTLDMVLISGKENVHIRDIIFDGNGMLTEPMGGTLPDHMATVLFSECSDSSITHCSAIGWHKVGFAGNIVPNFRISHNTVTRASATGVFENYGILVSAAVGYPSGNVEIHKNTLRQCQISANVFQSRITYNDIRYWGFSAAINIQELAAICYENVISHNWIQESLTVPDKYTYLMGGIENWSPRTVIEGNIVLFACGNGIDNGGADCTVSGNVCFNNGSGGAGASGIFSLADLVTVPNSSASGSLYTGNRCSQGTGTQTYGYSEQTGAGLTNIIIDASNNFQGNASGEMLLRGGTYTGVTSGTWTPTVTASAGAITSYTATGVYRKHRKIVYFSVAVTITDPGTASGRLVVTLPTSTAGAGRGHASGLASAGAKGVTGTIYDHSAAISLLLTDGSFPLTGQPVYVAGTYEEA